MKIDQLHFKCVEVTFHWRIVIGAAWSAHALYHTIFVAETDELLRCELASLIGMQDHPGFSITGSQGTLHGIYGQCRIDTISAYTGYDSTIVKVYDRTVVTLGSVVQKQIGEIDAPFFVSSGCSKILFQMIWKYPVRLTAFLINILFLSRDGPESKLFVHVFMNGLRTQIYALIPQ